MLVWDEPAGTVTRLFIASEGISIYRRGVHCPSYQRNSREGRKPLRIHLARHKFSLTSCHWSLVMETQSLQLSLSSVFRICCHRSTDCWSSQQKGSRRIWTRLPAEGIDSYGNKSTWQQKCVSGIRSWTVGKKATRHDLRSWGMLKVSKRKALVSRVFVSTSHLSPKAIVNQKTAGEQ